MACSPARGSGRKRLALFAVFAAASLVFWAAPSAPYTPPAPPAPVPAPAPGPVARSLEPQLLTCLFPPGGRRPAECPAPVPAPVPAPAPMEDQPGWDCRVHGNRSCGGARAA